MLAEKRGLNRRPIVDVDAVADQCARFFLHSGKERSGCMEPPPQSIQ
jgi:hypothetical protein